MLYLNSAHIMPIAHTLSSICTVQFCLDTVCPWLLYNIVHNHCSHFKIKHVVLIKFTNLNIFRWNFGNLWSTLDPNMPIFFCLNNRPDFSLTSSADNGSSVFSRSKPLVFFPFFQHHSMIFLLPLSSFHPFSMSMQKSEDWPHFMWFLCSALSFV